MHPPFSLGLAQRKRAVHGPKERRFWPLYTKADGRFLRHCRRNPEVSYRLRRTLCYSAASRRKSRESGSCRGGRPKGPFSSSRALRAYPGNKQSPPQEGVAKRNARGQNAGAFRFCTPMTTQAPACGGRLSIFIQCPAQPAEGFRVWSAGSEETPGLTFAEQRSRPAFSFPPGAATFLLTRQKKSGGASPAGNPRFPHRNRCNQFSSCLRPRRGPAR